MRESKLPSHGMKSYRKTRVPAMFRAMCNSVLPGITLILGIAIGAILLAPLTPTELEKSIYSSACGLIAVGILGGLLKLLYDRVTEETQQREKRLAQEEREREADAQFVSNVLNDLKNVYYRVERAQLLIPAHQSVKTYGDEMQALIEARVQLKSVKRALETNKPEQEHRKWSETVQGKINSMAKYIEELVDEFRDRYKSLSDEQRAYEERSRFLIKEYAEKQSAEVLSVPDTAWKSMSHLNKLREFILAGHDYETRFEGPLDEASCELRTELARLVRGSQLAE